MKKHQFAIITGILLTLFTFMSCDPLTGSSAGTGTGVTNENYFKVTFDFGKYGENTFHQSKVTNTTLNNFVNVELCTVKDEYKLQVEFLYWHEAGVDAKFDTTKQITSDITLYAKYKAKDVGAVNIKPDTDSLFVSWKNISDSKYKVEYTVGKEAEKTEVISDNFMTIKNVAEGTNCTIFVTTISNDPSVDNSERINGFGKAGRKHLDRLVLLYMDGDNDLNDPIYLDLNEVEYGLSKLVNTDYDNLKIVALWDGWDFKTNAGDDDGVSFFNQAAAELDVHATAATRLLELAADKNQLYGSNGSISFLACQLSPNTKDLTATADWIKNGEVDMSKEETLEKYLKWALANYDADKIILQFSNHGGGPRSASFGKNSYGRRSMCWDSTSTDGSLGACLKTADVSKALKNAGFGTENKLELIMEDVCLGGSLEEAYEFKDYANYYIGSPNNIPGMGFDYVKFVESLRVKNTTLDIGTALVEQYKNDYKMSDSDWEEILEGYGITAENASSLSYKDQAVISLWTPTCSTLSLIDLSMVGAVKTAVNELATVILSKNGDDPYLKRDSKGYYELAKDGKYYLNGNAQNEGVDGENLSSVPVKEAIKYFTAYYGDPICYQGTFGCLKDLGYMTYIIAEEKYSSDSELKTAAENVQKALDKAIKTAWRDGYKNSTYYYYDSYGYKIVSSASYLNLQYLGLTINTAVWVNHKSNVDGKISTYHEYEDWYENELAFGKDCDQWTALVKDWFNTTN